MDCLGPGCNVFRFSYMESILLVMWKHFNNRWDTCFLEACVSDYHTMSLTLSGMDVLQLFQLHELVQFGLWA